MEWTWRTATESNMPMGNAVALEGNAVAGGATASAVTQPPVDTASLASSHTNKHHHMRHTSSGQLHHSSASVLPPE